MIYQTGSKSLELSSQASRTEITAGVYRYILFMGSTTSLPSKYMLRKNLVKYMDAIQMLGSDKMTMGTGERGREREIRMDSDIPSPASLLVERV